MNFKKPLIVAGAVATVGVSSLAGLGIANAATSAGDSDSLVDKIATKFNLKKADVQAVFDTERTERETERQAEMSKHLQTLVDEGKITAAQKTLIEAKQKEVKAAFEKERTELKAWADTNNIELRYVMGPGMRGDSDRLQSLVDDGTITAAQKTLIENKQAELKTKRDAAKTALDKWASDNGIDTQYLMGGFGRGHGPGGPGGPGGMVR